MEYKFTEENAQEEIEKGRELAVALLEDEDKIETFLQKLEKKIKEIPLVGNALSNIPILISLVRNYVKKEYTDIPLNSIIAIVSALVYFLSPVDVIPDVIPVIGYLDDAVVIATCWKFVETDIKKYEKWREDRDGAANL